MPTPSATRPGETEFLATYDPREYPRPSQTADVCIFTLRDGLLQILLIERGDHPYKRFLALPGGFVNSQNTREEGGESSHEAALRELAEKTSLHPFPGHLEQLGTWDEPGRDPRGKVVTVAYLALASNLPDPQAGSDADDARYWPIADLDLDNQITAYNNNVSYEGNAPALAFDHAIILSAGLERVRSKLEYTTLAVTLLPEQFTLPSLTRVYEAVWGIRVDPANLRRKILKTDGFVQETGIKNESAGGRPPLLYRKGAAKLLTWPFMRPGPEETNEGR